jgi:hypothetical protein
MRCSADMDRKYIFIPSMRERSWMQDTATDVLYVVSAGKGYEVARYANNSATTRIFTFSAL